jgi:hypothetical protein
LWLEAYADTAAAERSRRKETVLVIPLVEDVLNAAK